MGARSRSDSRTTFGVLAERAEEAVQTEGIATLSFLDACQAYGDTLVRLGKAASIIHSDFSKNFAAVDAFYRADPESRGTLAELCGTEGLPEVNMTWLLRGLEYFMTLLQKYVEGDHRAGRTAYDLTLRRHHTRVQQWAFKGLVLAVPSKDDICSNGALCLELDGESSVHEVLQRDLERAAKTMSFVVQRAMAINSAAPACACL